MCTKFRSLATWVEPLHLAVLSPHSENSYTADAVSSLLPKGASRVSALSRSGFFSEYLWHPGLGAVGNAGKGKRVFTCIQITLSSGITP